LTSVAGQKSKTLTKKSKDEEDEEDFGIAAKLAIQHQGIDMENLSDIDLNMDYSDDEDEIHFDNDKAAVNHLFSLEENNLFKIKHLEDAHQTLERIKQQS
jgi:hypothetical protein